MKTINLKLLGFQKEISTIKKDGKNPHFKNSYATLPKILSEVKPLLTEFGLILLQPINNNEVETIIIDSETNEKISSSIKLPDNLNPQQLGSAITYFRRYLLAGLLSLEIDDDDANLTNKAVQQKPNATTEILLKAKQGGFSLEQIKTKYTITTQQQQEFINL
jgi:hypothetical protein